jgi:hypothetical protein
MDDVYILFIQREPSARVPSETQLAQQLEAVIWADGFTKFEPRIAVALLCVHAQRLLNKCEFA